MKKYLFLCLLFLLFIIINTISTKLLVVKKREEITVRVIGEVKQELELNLPINSTYKDLIILIEPNSKADLRFLQQNITLKHNDVIIIPAYNEVKKVSINTADIDELTTLPGVGEALAKRIIEYRQTHGLFQKLSDIKLVKGIKDKLFKKLVDKICL